MKFAFVVTNLAGGGAEKALLKLATALQARGHEVVLVVLEDRRQHAVPSGVAVRVLACRVGKGWLGKRLAAWRLRRALVAGRGYDMIVSTLPFADEVAILAHLPRHWCRIANNLSAEIAILARRDEAKSRRRLLKYRKLYDSHSLIAVSRGVAGDLGRLVKAGRIEYIPNPFDAAAISVDAKRGAPDLPTVPYVVHVGRFAPQKRHDLLLDAWRLLETDHLLVLLADPASGLEDMIRSRGLQDRVRIAGFRENVYPWIAGADLLVLCSDHEGLPNVLIEALLCGTPAVSTDCPSGPAEILAAFPGCLVPCGDANALAAAMGAALANRPEVGRSDLSIFAADRVAAAYEALARSAGKDVS